MFPSSVKRFFFYTCNVTSFIYLFIYLCHHIRVTLEDRIEDKYASIQNYRIIIIIVIIIIIIIIIRKSKGKLQCIDVVNRLCLSMFRSHLKAFLGYHVTGIIG